MDDEWAKDSDVGAVGAVLRDSEWWAYAQMILVQNEVMDDFLAWLQGCPCHPDPECRNVCTSKPELSEISPSTDAVVRCPLMGCRAPDLANGHWKRFLDAGFGKREDEVLALCVQLGPQVRAELLAHWGRVRDAFVLGMSLRFQFYDKLPHKLFGLATTDQYESRAAAAECLRLWDESPISHPKAVQLLKDEPGSLRQQVVQLSHGEDLQKLPQLAATVLSWRFASVVERSIEGKHAQVKKRLHDNSKPAPAAVSLALRLQELYRDMHSPSSRQLPVYVYIIHLSFTCDFQF